MDAYEFTRAKIDDYAEKVGIDIRPVIEPKLDRHKLFDVGNKLVEKFPSLCESLVQSPVGFSIRKRFIFPGKGEIDLETLAITPRGPVFTFPHRVGAFEEDVELGFNGLDSTVKEYLKVFHQSFPEKKVFRVGLVSEYVFNTGSINSSKLICDRFTRLRGSEDGEIALRVNRPTDDYNRQIEMSGVRRLEPIPEMPGQMQTANFGVKVVIDFNNRDMSRNLSESQILVILAEAKRFNDEDLLGFLNGPSGGEA